MGSPLFFARNPLLKLLLGSVLHILCSSWRLWARLVQPRPQEDQNTGHEKHHKTLRCIYIYRDVEKHRCRYRHRYEYKYRYKYKCTRRYKYRIQTQSTDAHADTHTAIDIDADTKADTNLEQHINTHIDEDIDGAA